MDRIQIRKLALAFGLTWALFYLGCSLLMILLGPEGTVWFFNSLLHGLDTSTVVRMDVPFSEFLIGLISSFVLGWLAGAIIAYVYNLGSTKNPA